MPERRLGAVIPVFNQAAEIGPTLTALDTAIGRTAFTAEVVVVDDGSTDGTASAVRAWKGRTPVRVVDQENTGRFAARRRGLQETGAEYALLLDSRVAIDPDALAFVERQLDAAPDRQVWNGHVDIVTAGNPFGVFWDVITRRAFAAYFRAPTTTSFGPTDFERFPKGTTCFFAPRRVLGEAFDAFRSSYADLRNANDDTPVIRWIAERQRINISPGFSCRYSARRRLRPFLRHGFHRGVVFVDGHGRRASRFFPIVVAFFPLSVGWLVASVFVPALVAVPPIVAAAAGVALAVPERRVSVAATMAWVTPLYALAHGAGMWRGVWLAARAWLGGGGA